MTRRDLLAALTVSFGAGVAPGQRAARDAGDWKPVREWELGPDSPLHSLGLEPGLPLLILDASKGLTADRVVAALRAAGPLPQIAIVEVRNPCYAPLSEFAQMVNREPRPALPAFLVLERRGTAERVRLLTPTSEIVLTRDWALRALAKQERHNA